MVGKCSPWHACRLDPKEYFYVPPDNPRAIRKNFKKVSISVPGAAAFIPEILGRGSLGSFLPLPGGGLAAEVVHPDLRNQGDLDRDDVQ